MHIIECALIYFIEQHRKSVQRYRQQLRMEAEAKHNEQQRGKGETKKPMTDEELWARLDELELREKQENEMERDMYILFNC